MRQSHLRNSDDRTLVSLVSGPELCRQHYDVELVATTFDAPLWETVRLMRGTDVFLGMHGAGFTNVLWLRRVSAPRPRP